MPNPVNMQVELAKYQDIKKYIPKIGDFIVWHGWFTYWYGIINEIRSDGIISIVCENLPKLLLSLDESQYKKYRKLIPLFKIKSSKGGEWAVLQNGVWFIDG